MKVTKVALVLLWVPAVLSTNEMRRVYRRQSTGILPVPSPQTSPSQTTPTSTTPTSTSTTPTSTTPTSTSTTPTSTPTTTPTTTSPTTTSPTTTKQSTTKTDTIVTTDDDGQLITRTRTILEAATPSPTPTDPPPPPPKSNTQATIIGLSVAGGVALLGVIAFIVWKMRQKRFSQFDDDDAAAIKWPEAAPDAGVNRAAVAAEAGVASRPIDPYGTHATNSTVELDPYQVPPLPQGGGYRDDPNIQAGGYYDPYRGPVPGTFASPPQSNDGHGGAPWQGEAIPMSVRRGTPGPPGGYDDYRRGSPAPYGGGAPSIRRGPSPGPNFAPDYGRSSPAPPPPNYNRPPGNVPYNDPYGGTA